MGIFNLNACLVLLAHISQVAHVHLALQIANNALVPAHATYVRPVMGIFNLSACLALLVHISQGAHVLVNFRDDFL